MIKPKLSAWANPYKWCQRVSPLNIYLSSYFHNEVLLYSALSRFSFTKSHSLREFTILTAAESIEQVSGVSHWKEKQTLKAKLNQQTKRYELWTVQLPFCETKKGKLSQQMSCHVTHGTENVLMNEHII